MKRVPGSPPDASKMIMNIFECHISQTDLAHFHVSTVLTLKIHKNGLEKNRFDSLRKRIWLNFSFVPPLSPCKALFPISSHLFFYGLPHVWFLLVFHFLLQRVQLWPTGLQVRWTVHPKLTSYVDLQHPRYLQFDFHWILRHWILGHYGATAHLWNIVQRANSGKREFFQPQKWMRQRVFNAWGIQTGPFPSL